MAIEFPLEMCKTKGLRDSGVELTRGASWVTARRGNLELYEDRLRCGDWTIPYDELEEASLFHYRVYFVAPAYVLRVQHEGVYYQFGLNPNRYWAGVLPFEVTRAKAEFSFSAFSIVVRVLWLGLATWWVWARFLK